MSWLARHVFLEVAAHQHRVGEMAFDDPAARSLRTSS